MAGHDALAVFVQRLMDAVTLSVDCVKENRGHRAAESAK